MVRLFVAAQSWHFGTVSHDDIQPTQPVWVTALDATKRRCQRTKFCQIGDLQLMDKNPEQGANLKDLDSLILL
jgi:hypothetical protein